MVQLNWTNQAINDLKNIADYISLDSVRYARLQIKKIRMRTDILKTQMHSGKSVEEINNINIRELVEGNYRIIYKIVDSNRVDIITIHHSARDLSKPKFN